MKSRFFLICMSLIASGCETSIKRDCGAFFRPDYALWGQQQVNDTLVFTDQNNVSELFTVSEIEPNVPFQTEDFGSRESDVACGLSLEEVLVRQNSTETIRKLFTHAEFSDRDIAEENFFLRVFIGESTDKQGDFLIDLKKLENDFNSTQRLHSFYPELEVGGILYADVLRQELINQDLLQEPDQVSKITFASGFGLVQYTRVNGSVFSLVP